MASRLSIKTLRDPYHFLAMGGGVGLAPRAPGTAGSVLALVPFWFVSAWTFPFKLAIGIVVFALVIWICGVSARRLGSKDDPAIVLDEIAAMLILMTVVPEDWFQLLLALLFFRVFDIWKPWPIRDLDHRLSGGLGIMLDDLMAAVYAAACLMVIRYSYAVF